MNKNGTGVFIPGAIFILTLAWTKLVVSRQLKRRMSNSHIVHVNGTQ